MNSTWNLNLRDNIQLLQLGDLLSEQTNREVLEQVDALLKEGHVNYVIDLGAAQYVNSIGLNLLIIIRERARSKGGRVILAQAGPLVVRLLEMTKLYPLFMMADSVEAAIDALSSQKN